MKTKVLFRMFQGSALALFPAIAATVGKPWHCLSYARMGQHGATDTQGVIHESRPATPKEYCELAAELRKIGYRLDIRKRTNYADFMERKAQLRDA